MAKQIASVTLFLSYAQKDEFLLRKLETHLSLLKRQGLISLWYNRQIIPGTERAQVIDEQLERASMILLLVSPDFLASDYCYQTEMKRALELHKANQTRVIPIVLRPVDWQDAPFAHLQALPANAKAITTWSNVDEALVEVVTGIRRAIEALSLLPAETLHISLPAIWGVPYPQNFFFTGREDLLSRLHTRLQAGQATALSQSPQAISGLGGIGKTQIAVEYAFRYHYEYDVVLWAHAESEGTLISSYNLIANQLKLFERGALEQNIIILAVKKWLQTHRKWLLILDNADDLDLLPAFLPSVLGGHLLFTTRAQATGHLAQRIEVNTFSLEEGALFLLRRATLIGPDEELAQASIRDRQLAIQITQEMGGLPLALDQAGAYLEETKISLDEYQRVYQHHQADLLKRRGRLVTDHPEPVTTTWFLSFQRVKQSSAAAADMLRLCAFLDPDAIPEEIISQGASVLSRSLRTIGKDPLKLHQAIEILQRSSLIIYNAQASLLHIHRLVQAVIKNSMSRRERHRWSEYAINAMIPICTLIKSTVPARYERYLSNELICASLIEHEKIYTDQAQQLLLVAGHQLRRFLRFEEALALFDLAISIDDGNGEAWNGKGYALRNLDRLDEALAAFERAIQLDAGIVDAYMGVGFVLRALNRCELALDFFEEAIKLDWQASYPYVGKGFALYSLNRNEEALEMFEHAIQLNSEEMEAYVGIGYVQKRFQRYKQSLEAFKRVLQRDPHNSDANMGLGLLISESLQSEQALDFFEKAIQPHPISSYWHVGKGRGLYHLARYEEALQVYEHAIYLNPKETEAHVGKGQALLRLKRYDEAIAAFDQAIIIDPSNQEASRGRDLALSQRTQQDK